MDFSKEGIVQVLMKRDGMDEIDAGDLVNDCQEEIDVLLMSGCEGFDGLETAEDIIADYFGLEPDYLMAFI